jgi:hypothetical protein
MTKTSNKPENFLNIMTKAMDNKIYGSIEFFFEDGNVTQITQRVIKKINSKKDTAKKTTSNGQPAQSQV